MKSSTWIKAIVLLSSATLITIFIIYRGGYFDRSSKPVILNQTKTVEEKIDSLKKGINSAIQQLDSQENLNQKNTTLLPLSNRQTKAVQEKIDKLKNEIDSTIRQIDSQENLSQKKTALLPSSKSIVLSEYQRLPPKNKKILDSMMELKMKRLMLFSSSKSGINIIDSSIIKKWDSLSKLNKTEK